MMEMARLLKPETYVEIGIAGGYTFSRMLNLPFIKRFVGVDLLPLPEPIRQTKDPRIEFYQMHSQSFAKRWRDPIDMLFIDADHRKESLTEDLLSIGDFVKFGTGIIFLHDTHPIGPEWLDDDKCSNAWEVASEAHRSPKRFWEIVTLPGPIAGLSILRKPGKHHLSWMKNDGQS